jgi:hypothetical protein
MPTHKRAIGIEQVDDKVTMHYAWDPRPIFAYLAWAAIIAIVLLVAGSCDDGNGMYQGPNDSAPRYGGPR